MVDQGKNAANEGDMLKHPLICDVLFLCSQQEWKSITYAETHAGAGVYSSEHQNVGGCIAKLKQKHDDAKEDTQADDYFFLLREFWQNPETPSTTSIKYAGSAVLAAMALKKQKLKQPNICPCLRLTETDPVAFETLKTSLAGVFTGNNSAFDFDGTTCIRQAGFQDNVDWLTSEDNLVLVIDPFKLSLGSKAIKDGGIDLFHLLQLMERCKKKSATVGFWYSTDANSNRLGLPGYFAKTIFANYYITDTQNIRTFTWKNYEMIWVGFGNGVKVVESLPTADALNARWFCSSIKERVYLQSALPKLAEYMKQLPDVSKQSCSMLLKRLKDNMDRVQEEL